MGIFLERKDTQTLRPRWARRRWWRHEYDTDDRRFGVVCCAVRMLRAPLLNSWSFVAPNDDGAHAHRKMESFSCRKVDRKKGRTENSEREKIGKASTFLFTTFVYKFFFGNRRFLFCLSIRTLFPSVVAERILLDLSGEYEDNDDTD